MLLKLTKVKDPLSIPNIDTAQYLNKYSTREVNNFLHPRGPMDDLTVRVEKNIVYFRD